MVIFCIAISIVMAFFAGYHFAIDEFGTFVLCAIIGATNAIAATAQVFP